MSRPHIIAATRLRAHPHLRAGCPRPHRESHHRFYVPAATRTSTTTHAYRYSHFRRFWPRPVIMRHDPGLAASPPVRYTLKVEGVSTLHSLCRPLWTDNLLAKRRRAPDGGIAGPGGSPRTCGCTAEREVLHLFSKAGSNVVESAAALLGDPIDVRRPRSATSGSALSHCAGSDPAT